MFKPQDFAGLTTPSARNKVASRYFLDRASTPPFQGGECAGNEQAIGRRIEEQSLRLFQIRKRLQTPAALYVEHLDRVVPQSRHEERLTFHVGGEMIHASVNIRQRDTGFQ